MLVSKISLNDQGRLILRENGKLIIPYEQFANAIMMKHLHGPHGIHLSLENTIIAVMDNFTVGKESFGMEKEFIIEIVQNCPNPDCRYNKIQFELSQKAASMGLIYTQKCEIDSNLFHNSDLQMILNTPISSRIQTSLSDSSETKNTNNLLLNNQSSNIKNVTTKLFDSSLIVLPSSESYRLTDFLRINSESYENLVNVKNLEISGKELLSIHNGVWSIDTEIKNLNSTTICDGQEKSIRSFTEIMKNMTRIKSCVRTAMCKPYGKQSETLQKTLVDTIQLIQSLRRILPSPHISILS